MLVVLRTLVTLVLLVVLILVDALVLVVGVLLLVVLFPLVVLTGLIGVNILFNEPTEGLEIALLVVLMVLEGALVADLVFVEELEARADATRFVIPYVNVLVAATLYGSGLHLLVRTLSQIRTRKISWERALNILISIVILE